MDGVGALTSGTSPWAHSGASIGMSGAGLDADIDVGLNRKDVGTPNPSEVSIPLSTTRAVSKPPENVVWAAVMAVNLIEYADACTDGKMQNS